MCGICGIYNFEPSGRIEEGLLEKMCAILRHRGPDGEGKYFGFEIAQGRFKMALGHRRLSIVDSAAGRQPLANEQKTVWAVCDGEIYNFEELRRDCERRGHHFSTSCDVETIVHLYEDYGPGCVGHLRGMFAFAIWDTVQKKLFLARDRLGQKPLHYAFLKNNLIFASEIKAILLHPGLQKKVNWQAFLPYLTFSALPAPLTMFEGIHKLESGTAMTVESDGRSRIDTYWDFFNDAPKVTLKSEEASEAYLLDTLKEAVKIHTIGDGPKGVFLSGGVDSSLITALLARSGTPLKTFTTGFEGGGEHNEFQYARRVADLYGTEHREFSLNEKDFSDSAYRTLLDHEDEPILSPACVPYYFNSKEARLNGVKVAFTGEGGDELFLGYPFWSNFLKYKKYFDLFSGFPHCLQSFILSLWGRKSRHSYGYGLLERSHRRQPLFWGSAETFSQSEKQDLLGGEIAKGTGKDSTHEIIHRYFSRFSQSGLSGDYGIFMTYLDLKIKMAELFLRRMDHMSMANSLEVRNPMLDHKFVEASLAVSSSFKIKNHISKYILRKMAKGYVPSECIYRGKKGWGLAASQWYFRSVYDAAGAREKIASFTRRTGYFNPEYIRKLLVSDTLPGMRKQWRILAFIKWHERWIEDNVK